MRLSSSKDVGKKAGIAMSIRIGVVLGWVTGLPHFTNRALKLHRELNLPSNGD